MIYTNKNQTILTQVDRKEEETSILQFNLFIERTEIKSIFKNYYLYS